MKKFLMFLCLILVGSAHATTVNLNWLVDDTTYAQTTCETGGNFAVPSTPPTKYGYTFSGWVALIKGTVEQNGTPSPTNPIEPVFYQGSDGMILRAINDSVADTYNPLTGKITRRVGVKAFNGTENWDYGELGGNYYFSTTISDVTTTPWFPAMSTHFAEPNSGATDNVLYTGSTSKILRIKCLTYTDTTTWKQYLADQYANGTPVTVYYQLATPVEEVWNGQ